MKIKINVPDNISGEWEVKTFEITEGEAKFANMRAAFRGRGYINAGIYKKLLRGGEIIMSNSPDEIADFMSFVYKAKGNILINGLGLGVLLKALLDKEEVENITVIERSIDVIKLVGKTYLKDKRVNIICADAFKWKPLNGTKYDYVWHDIWDYITSDNLSEMKKLTRKYSKISGYQESWCRKQCNKLR